MKPNISRIVPVCVKSIVIYGFKKFIIILFVELSADNVIKSNGNPKLPINLDIALFKLCKSYLPCSIYIVYGVPKYVKTNLLFTFVKIFGTTFHICAV